MCRRKRGKKRVPVCLCEKEKKKIKGKRELLRMYKNEKELLIL